MTTRTFWNGTINVRAYEVEDADAEPGGRALVFESDFGRRFAFVFPADWRSLSDDALARLAEQTPD